LRLACDYAPFPGSAVNISNFSGLGVSTARLFSNR